MREVALVSRKSAAPARGGQAEHTQRYWAFLSYSHRDSASADWLHDALEKYRVPRTLVGKQTPRGIVPAGFSPIFRDRHELAASGDLAHTIREALAGSRCLIVLCSPEAARSRWTNEEIIAFKKAHPAGCVLAAIVEGEPFASELKGHEAEECFPPALKKKFDSRGRPTDKRAEPIAADLRENGDGRQLGLLKIVAGMIGVGLDDLIQREQQRRNRRLTYIAAASLTGMTITSGLSVFAFEKRDEARDQRREAEGLVGFMLGDLREKLEPIGRLDALDAVGTRALEYFEKQNKSELSDAALAQRSKALALMGEIAQTRGDTDGALRRYREAMAGTAEMVLRRPDQPQRLYEHAQNVFWVGEIARQRGKLNEAEAAMREYKRLADRMVTLEPDERRWQMEVQYADTNLGVVLLKQRRFAEAPRQFQEALMTIERFASAEPRNTDYQKSLAESLAWLADARRSEGRLDDAIAQRERQIALLTRLNQNGSDVEYRQKLIPAHQALGRLFASKGELKLADVQLQTAVNYAEQLIPTEPENMKWVDLAAGAKLSLAEVMLASGRTEEAAVITRSACDLISRLVAKDATVAGWRKLRRNCLITRARIALGSGSNEEAQALAEQAVASATAVRSDDPIEDRYWISATYKLVGDAYQRSDNGERAQSAWQRGLAGLPKSAIEQPWEAKERADLLQRLGRRSEATRIAQRLAAIGYRGTN